MTTARQNGGSSRFPPVRKSLGQHFLTDRGVLERIADAAQLTGSETVIEIGPGRGALTDLLVDRAGRLIGVEYDRALAAQLTARFANRSGVEIVQADVLSVNFGALAGGPYRLIGNVPYYITTPILFQALERPRPDVAVYLVQREVADRLAASPGGKEYGALTVNVSAVAHVEILFGVPASAFKPSPKVESAVIRVTPRIDPAVLPEDEAALRALVQSIFTMRRKQMQRIVRSIWHLDATHAIDRLAGAGIDPMARPETLDTGAFARLLALSSRRAIDR